MFENGGNLVVQEVATQPLTQDLLRSSVNIFYLFMGSSDALTTRRGFSLIVLLFPLSGLLHFGPKRLQCDGVERQTGLQGRAARSPQQGGGEFIKQLHRVIIRDASFLPPSQSLRVIKDTPGLLICSTRALSKPRTTHPAPEWRWWQREESQQCSSNCSSPGEIKSKLRVLVPPTVWER